MGTNEDGDDEASRDWLEGRQGLDRETLARVEADRVRERSGGPDPSVWLTRARIVAGTPLRAVARGVRWVRSRRSHDEATDADRPRPIADGTDAPDVAHDVGARTARPDPAADTPDIEDASEFIWGEDDGAEGDAGTHASEPDEDRPPKAADD
jgi:hypothetical protein